MVAPNGRQWTDTTLESFALVGPTNTRIAKALMHLEPAMRDEVMAEARRMAASGRLWPDAVELVTAATLAGGLPRVFVTAWREVCDAGSLELTGLRRVEKSMKGMNGS